MQEIYHLYHHQPEPLDLATLNDEIWLMNNGDTYRFVGTVKAMSPEQAYEGLRAKTEGHSLRAVEIRSVSVMRATLPGDVLVGERKAWMVLPDGQLHLLPYKDTPTWKSYTHNSLVRCLSWSPDGKHLAACSDYVWLHDLLGRDERHMTPTYRHHGSRTDIRVVAWSPDGMCIASGDSDAAVHIWKPAPHGSHLDASLGSIVICRTEETNSRYTQDIQSLTWSPDARTVLAGRRDSSVVEWDTVTGSCLRIVRRNTQRATAFAFTTGGTHIASISEDGVLHVWSLEQDDLDIVCKQTGEALACAWAPDGDLLVSSCQGEESLQCWDALSGIPGERIPLSISSRRLLTIRALSWSLDGRFLAAGCGDGTIQVIDMQRLRHIQTYRVTDMRIDYVAWSPDGRYLAAGVGSAVQIWRWEEGQAPQPTDIHA